jgi:hypothetical protein
MPQEKLANTNQLDVFFMGDSIILHDDSKNVIGSEFRRMLSTDDTGGTQSDGSIKLQALNLCAGKIRLVGEQEGVNSNIRYQYTMYLQDVFTGKRDIPYGDSRGEGMAYWQSHNPYYNPDSVEPDEVGEDGFNKRVDFAWYFQNACGAGKYPKLIYISIGANDYSQSGTWDLNIIPSLTVKHIALYKKIKAACDSIAGGDSVIKIKVFGHQTYPLSSATINNIKMENARIMQNQFYDSLYNAIHDTDNGVSTYVDFVDCASKYDWENGYDGEQIASNPRCVREDDYYIPETVHMNNVGCFNYADCLIDDFIADTTFD